MSPSRFWPEAPDLNWCVEVRPAAHAATDEHVLDLAVVHEAFAEQLGSGRLDYGSDFELRVAAASEAEAARFERDVAQLVAEHNLYVVARRYSRPRYGVAWQDVTPPEEPPSEDEIERELDRYIGPEAGY
jgi:hypothetical protein